MSAHQKKLYFHLVLRIRYGQNAKTRDKRMLLAIQATRDGQNNRIFLIFFQSLNAASIENKTKEVAVRNLLFSLMTHLIPATGQCTPFMHHHC
ncbi:hypothetical protein [Pantoea ananatis]|uniref:hypothetical protein n=1 Tax=Pantoea ananas TaxID=553 RepID=UPI001B3165F8|nr:hypothetical protein [Pantoea ananatis]